MILIPAIDILRGNAVRLMQGSFAESTVYDSDPLEAAVRWESAGARALHVVDLDGAKIGRPINLEHIRRITDRVQVPVQVGGGLRAIDAIDQVIAAGATRVVLGTAAFDDVDLLDAAVDLLGDRLAVSVDVRNGQVATRGWTDELQTPVPEVIRQLGERGITSFVYSSIDRDGTLGGPDLDAVREVASSVRGTFLYSGGISTLEDLRALSALREVNLAGVIVGKALYEQRFSVDDGQRTLDEETKKELP